MTNVKYNLRQSPRTFFLASYIGVSARKVLHDMVDYSEVDVEYANHLSKWMYGWTGTIELKTILLPIVIYDVSTLYFHTVMADLDAAQIKMQ